MRHTGWIIVPFVAALVTGRASGDYYVARNGQTPGDFLSWATAASNIQEAVDAATGGSTVWVSNGVYRAASGDRVVYINKELNLRAAGPRDQVVVDGQNARRCVVLSRSSPAYILVDGFTLTNGYADGFNYFRGSGMYIRFSAMTGTAVVQNCTISGNRSVGGGSDYNSAPGGGLFAWGADGSQFDTILRNCTLSGNTATNRDSFGGGAALIWTRLTMEDCVVERNRCAGQPAVTRPSRGGGIYVNNLAAGSVIRNTIVRNNRAAATGSGADAGGGIGVTGTGTDLLIEGCVLQNNDAPYGGGVHQLEGKLTTRSCLVVSNRADIGGGWYHGWSGTAPTAYVQNCTIVTNRATGSSGARPGGVYFRGGAMSLRNTIVYYNAGANGNYYLESGSIGWSYSCMTPLWPYGGTTNSTTAPGFVDWKGGDYRLPKTSWCVDSGGNQSWMSSARDVERRPRIDSGAGIVDRGCYEWHPSGTAIIIR